MRAYGWVALAAAMVAPGATQADVRGRSFVCPAQTQVTGNAELLNGQMMRGVRIFVTSSGQVLSLMRGCSERLGSTSGGSSRLNGGPSTVTLNCSQRQGGVAVTQTASFANGMLTLERRIVPPGGGGRRMTDRFAIKVDGDSALLVRLSRDVEHRRLGSARVALVGTSTCKFGHDAPF